MRRRQFLAAVGLTGFAGCSKPLSPDSQHSTAPPSETVTSSSTDTNTPTETDQSPPEGPPQNLQSTSIVDLQTAPRTYCLSPTQYRSPDEGIITTWFTAPATTDHPATVSATLENANDFANTFRIQWTPPFGRITSRIPRPFGDNLPSSDYTYRVGLILAPTANHDLVDEPPQVELSSDGYWRLADGIDQWLPEQVRLDPGETIHGEYVVVGRPEGVGKGRPTGSYEFRGSDDSVLQLAVWDTDNPGPNTQSRFAGTSLPPLSTEETTAWYHEADATTTTFVRPSRERGTLPVQVAFTFVNKSRQTTECGHWNLYKLVDGRWHHIVPNMHFSDCRRLNPGGAETWTLNAYHGDALSCLESCGAAGRNVGYLGGGRYAVVVGYGRHTDQSAALVDLLGDSVTVVPTEDVTATQSGTTMTVTSPKYEDGTHPPSATLTLTEADTADESIIPEQVMRPRYRGFRNTLAYVSESIDTVVLRTDEHVAESVVGYDNEMRRFVFNGQAYEVTIHRGAE
ncbi:hypothetical protein E6P09_07520 [Haloferax mediterranei ATCC 33500]|uniref:Uncharacterized protein n=1 Tax=Haloferax mediterranei (strain ATCC 33500 / DSM 1411 / JCM 8866 / NBRC 14739 / NCIMB 2177 / R-4) TaxID=523841 RepID=I3R307_HALMT|nr:hypothetical protein [Haloferax mediterranei]AFK18617.1 hypothetical protein HFX_0896 [Haloferax mediterranei ATCC 33500]AHZ22011.1 hypothetical protein BM92_04740 [Haloferax mediterranei ATCC 33500]EMA02106.1 hypothetical protein C439_05985 [Haloferax mediterranei ATCC 33500]MDX5988708.1 hypothetical protein [Haloferax mediterranei ATCC 33500]QCQ75116.1 hypothetical protein E6P09_07520 [Haloferax mediterranei ATCC 33500]